MNLRASEYKYETEFSDVKFRIQLLHSDQEPSLATKIISDGGTGKKTVIHVISAVCALKLAKKGKIIM